MKVLVTGGAGCIGSQLAERLLDCGHQVRVVDNLSSGALEHIGELLSRPAFQFIEGDLLAPETADESVAGMDIVFHLAANPDVKFEPGDPTDKDLQQNTLVTYNVLEAMRRSGANRLVFASTSAVYGKSEIQPIPETMCLRPISLYGATKAACETLIGAFSHLFGMRCWIFRFANVVGAKVRTRGRTVISDFIHRLQEDPGRLLILGDGQQAKSYLRVSDCIDGMLFAVEHAPAMLNTYNVGCDDSLPVNDIAEMVAAGMSLREVIYSYTGGEGGWPGDVPRFVLDVTALNRLGWRASYSSRQAVAWAIEESLRRQGYSPRHWEQPTCKP